MFKTTKGHLLNLGMALKVMISDLFRVDQDSRAFSFGEAWLVYAVYAAVCLWLLSRRVRAYEVVS